MGEGVSKVGVGVLVNGKGGWEGGGEARVYYSADEFME